MHGVQNFVHVILSEDEEKQFLGFKGWDPLRNIIDLGNCSEIFFTIYVKDI